VSTAEHEGDTNVILSDKKIFCCCEGGARGAGGGREKEECSKVFVTVDGSLQGGKRVSGDSSGKGNTLEYSFDEKGCGGNWEEGEKDSVPRENRI